MSRFGDELEYDLHRFCGVDLLDFFRGVHPWGKLHRLMLRLPWYSEYKRALEDDAEFWENYYARVEDPAELEGDPGAPPSLAAWDEWRELAADLKDQLAQQTISLLSPHVPKGKPKPKFKPVKRPKPARAKAAEARLAALDSAWEDDMMGMLVTDDPDERRGPPDPDAG